MVGTGGDDTLIGDIGQDSLTGGLGKDAFRCIPQKDSPVDLLDATVGTDVITDFTAADDGVSLGALAGTATNYRESLVNGSDGFGGANLAASGFISAADQAHGEGTNNGIRYFFGADSTSASGYLSFCINNDAAIDGNVVVLLQGVNTLAGFDFANIL